MRIVKVPGKEKAGVIPYGSAPEVELDIEVVPTREGLTVRVTNPNLTKVEISNAVELYEYRGFWKKVELGVVFLEKRIVLIPGETHVQKLPIELRPGRYRIVRFAYIDGTRVKVEKEFTVR